MRTLLPMIVSELAQGRAAALATVLWAHGSAPRGAGACQLLTQGGRAEGTVGGGVLERRALDELQALLASAGDGGTATSPDPDGNAAEALALAKRGLCVALGPSRMVEYALTQDEAQSLGMVCGGNVALLYQLLTPAMLPFFQALQARAEGGRNVWLARWLRGGRVEGMGYTDGSGNPTPLADAQVLPLCGRLAQWAQAATEYALFVEPVRFASHAYIFGGGHVAQCVAPLLAQLAFEPVVYDDRPEYADPALFPTAEEVICAPFGEAGARLHVTEEDEVVIMTRGHVNDQLTLVQALRTPAYYIGLIGSRSKVAHTRAMVLAQGFDEAAFERVHTPIGLPIGAETPMEIAVSVAAEMILCRARRAGSARATEKA